MKKKNLILKSAVLLMLFMLVSEVTAQQSLVDSAIVLLNKSQTPKGLDTATFLNARLIIRTAILSDAQVNQIEKAAEQFKKGNDEDLYYAVKFVIFAGLSGSDQLKAINYAKLNIAELEQSNTPHASYLAKVFLTSLRLPYRNSSKLAEGFQYYTEKVSKYKKAKDSLGLSNCYYVLGGFYRSIGLLEPAVYNMKKSVSLLDSSEVIWQPYLDFSLNEGAAGWINNSFVLVDYYLSMGDFEKAIQHGDMLMKVTDSYYKLGGNFGTSPGFSLWYGARHLAHAKIVANKLDSVDYYLKLAEEGIDNRNRIDKSAPVGVWQFRAWYDIKRGAYQEADSLLQQCWKWVNQYKISVAPTAGFIEPDYYLALLRIEQKNYPEAITFLLRNIERIKILRQSVLRDYKLLASLYEKTGEPLKAKEVYKSFISLQDSVTADQAKFRTISFETEQQISENEIAISKLETENKLSAQSRNFTIGIAALLLILAGSIYYRFQSKKKANKVLEITLADLRSTQAQLVQSEKMASLGELTAGIAHEIQNPLNFVNNFSEVSSELVDEAAVELNKGDLKETKAILNDLKGNLEKINHHGQRASSIVKGMLEHSRTSTGEKELTDINALAEEYLRLAYHGFRAKDKSFNANFTTDFDPNLPKINVIPQDIGRVLLNLINNAFQACSASRTSPSLHSASLHADPLQADPLDKGAFNAPRLEPTVSISTKNGNGNIEIRINDNGPGIPNEIKDKIFQPFFTTKATGQGTGLGLSLAYDIVKAHGGDLSVESKEGEGAMFKISLPIS